MKNRQTGLGILLLLAILNFVVIIYFWNQTSGPQLAAGGAHTLIALGRLSGLLAVLLVLGQIFMIARVRWLESLIGFDGITRYHRANGKTLIYLLIAHPILLVLGYSQLTDLNPLAQFIELWQLPYVIFASLALGLFVALVVVSAVGAVRRRLSYEQWYATHLFMYVAVLLAFFHQIANGGDFGNETFKSYWMLLYAVAFGVLIYFRFLKPIFLNVRHRFVVTRVVKDSDVSTSVYVGGKNMESFNYSPGQFNIWAFAQKGFPLQKHPFTISMEPNGKEVRLTAKALGDFTKAIPSLKPGAKAFIEGPFGIFTPDLTDNKNILMIAGGAGITPLRAMIPEMLEQHKNIILLYGNKTVAETMLLAELQKLTENSNFRLINILSEQAGLKAETGHIDAEKIKRLVPDFAQRDAYVCGPPQMIEGITKTLIDLGMPANRIYSERFSL